ncbi:hypothetical protein [Auritidibacter ignavus]|nr:hypothetical protein [Auritidibacter ignavus]NIH70820.1 DNA-binding transcriptional MocR family regulator [Auritidibacter ignavus]RMX22368.1 hypothetical protein DYI20_10410 [Auritidibacter ignavus]WGH86572.1 hypothetical protein QDX24_01795 [Auritidibacter ignavus]WHS34992.1 hypothetical protein QM403_11990 [Auritidibacter ignavus]
MAELITRWIRDGTAANIASALRAEAQTRLAIAASALGDLVPAVPSGGFHLRLPMPLHHAEEAARTAAREVLTVTPLRTILTDPSAPESGLRVCTGRAEARRLEQGLRRLRNIIVSHITSSASTHSR